MAESARPPSGSDGGPSGFPGKVAVVLILLAVGVFLWVLTRNLP